MLFVPTPAPLLVGLATTQSNSKSTSNTQSSSRTTTIGTISSSSSSYANTTSTSTSSSSRKVLSTGARVGLGFGLAFFLLLCLILFAYLKKRYQRTRENVNHQPAHLASSQYPPSQPVAPQGEALPPPPPLDAAYPDTQPPFPTPARPASFYSPTYLIPHETSASTTMMTTLNAPATDSSSNSQPERQLPPHADITRHQNELE